jgi:hypothetical protein
MPRQKEQLLVKTNINFCIFKFQFRTTRKVSFPIANQDRQNTYPSCCSGQIYSSCRSGQKILYFCSRSGQRKVIYSSSMSSQRERYLFQLLVKTDWQLCMAVIGQQTEVVRIAGQYSNKFVNQLVGYDKASYRPRTETRYRLGHT